MMLNEITRTAGARRRRKRVGRGESSGHGKTCGRGTKGCQSRSGGGVRPLSEGGQMPIFRRLPKRGFSNFQFRTRYEVVNLAALEAHFAEAATVDIAALRAARLIRPGESPVKVLGTGALSKKLTIEAHAFSDSARAAIEKAGGTIKLIARPDPAEQAKTKRKTAARKAVTKAPGGPAAPA